jgi:CheY-like chemotaxis protein
MTMSARVLLVEDHPTMRDAMRAILEADGYEVRETGDGTTALAEIRREPPDLVLLDLHIPGIAGDELLRVIKGDPATAKVHVVIVTAEGEEGRAPALRKGADDYVTKPFGPAALLRTIAQVLGASGSPEA